VSSSVARRRDSTPSWSDWFMGFAADIVAM
jgi:hypothetical protein